MHRPYLSILLIAPTACVDMEWHTYTVYQIDVVAHVQSTPPNDLPEYLHKLQTTRTITPITIEYRPGYDMLSVPHVACDYDGYVIRIRTITGPEVPTRQTCLPHEMAHHILNSRAHDAFHVALQAELEAL